MTESVQGREFEYRKDDAFWGTLMDDAVHARRLVNEADGQFERRGLVRAMGALFDGSAVILKSAALGAAREGAAALTRAELALLRDESYELNEYGVPRTRVRFCGAASGTAFAFRMFAKVYGLDHPLDIPSDGWRAVVEVTKVRNRLMHPKSVEDLVVTNEDIASADAAYKWHTLTHGALVRARTRQLEERIAELRRGNTGTMGHEGGGAGQR